MSHTLCKLTLTLQHALQAARKQGSKPEGTAQRGAAKEPAQREFGSDLEFYALRLHSTKEEAALDTHGGLDAFGAQPRCSIHPRLPAYQMHPHVNYSGCNTDCVGSCFPQLCSCLLIFYTHPGSLILLLETMDGTRRMAADKRVVNDMTVNDIVKHAWAAFPACRMSNMLRQGEGGP